ncbi:hypothetical protein QQ045_016083 [Rhodiola kirilowii]
MAKSSISLTVNFLLICTLLVTFVSAIQCRNIVANNIGVTAITDISSTANKISNAACDSVGYYGPWSCSTSPFPPALYRFKADCEANCH